MLKEYSAVIGVLKSRFNIAVEGKWPSRCDAQLGPLARLTLQCFPWSRFWLSGEEILGPEDGRNLLVLLGCCSFGAGWFLDLREKARNEITATVYNNTPIHTVTVNCGGNRKCSAHTAWVRLHYRRQDTWYGVIKEDVLMESRSRRNSTRWTEEVNPVLDARTSSTRNQMINYTVKRIKTNATLNQNNLHGKPELGETVTG